jgi:hypothetical protein
MANHDAKAVREAVTTSEQFNTSYMFLTTTGYPFELPAGEILL